MVSKPIPALDLLFYLMETSASPMHVGLLLVFEQGRAGVGDMAPKISAAYRRARPVAPFNLVPKLSLPRPRWIDAPTIDMEHHVQHRTLAKPGNSAQLLKLVLEFHEPALARDRPGFQVWIMDGLEDGGFAIYCKMHHALVDGMSAVMRVFASLNSTPASRRTKTFFGLELAQRKPLVPRALLHQLKAVVAGARQHATAVTELSTAMAKAVLAEVVSRQAAGNRPFTAPRTPMNGPLTEQRSFAMLQLPLAAMKAAGRPFGATMNDVAATIVDAALHRWLADQGAGPKRSLVAACAMSLREPGDTEAATKATGMFIPLGAPDATLGERIEQVVAANTAAKAEIRSVSKDAARLYGLVTGGMAGLTTAARADAVMRPLANFVLSNVPGSPEALYLRGTRLIGAYPISALGVGVGLNVTLLTYANTVNFGFLANGTLPNVGALARYTREAFDALQAASSKSPKSIKMTHKTARC